MSGVSCNFLSAAISALCVLHGNRFMSPLEKSQELVEALAKAEEAYASLEPAPELPGVDVVGLLRELVDGIGRWAGDEDGVPDFVMPAFRRAKDLLGKE